MGQDILHTLDRYGALAWAGVLVVAFSVYWPLGLGVLAYLVWSGRLAFTSPKTGSGLGGGPSQTMAFASGPDLAPGRETLGAMAAEPSGNLAFDDYRRQALQRLDGDCREFQAFIDRLRTSRDRTEFEQFLAAKVQSVQAVDSAASVERP
ncbi:MAG: DUF2852 domain-containing protein [Hyphomicrobium sp.]